MEKVFIKSNFLSANQLFCSVASILMEKHYVNDQFLNAIVKRESEFPTGLETSQFHQQGLNVAIPHVESEYCNANVLVFVLNENTLSWKEMVNRHDIDVNFFIFIISKDSSQHLNVLPKIIRLFKDSELHMQLLTVSDEEQLKEIVESKMEEE